MFLRFTCIARFERCRRYLPDKPKSKSEVPVDSKKQSQSPKPGAITRLFSRLFLFFCFASALPTLSATTVPVYPSQSLESMVNSYPAGTTFLIKAGVHRLQYAIPKNYDCFIGESGAVLDGAEHLTSFSQSGSH